MREIHASLVILDISGYTRFITHREISLVHAEQIITQLVGAVIDRAEHPLIVNKLQGDAALLYSEIPRGQSTPCIGILSQLGSLFDAFDRELASIGQQRSACPCDACRSVAGLDLKAFVHSGDILVKQVWQFEELAGEPVIFVHRLMKNAVDKKRYVLLSDAFVEACGKQPEMKTGHDEKVDGFGDCRLWLVDPAALPRLPNRPSPSAATQAVPGRSNEWNHFPNGEKPGFLALRWGLLKMKLGLAKSAK